MPEHNYTLTLKNETANDADSPIAGQSSKSSQQQSAASAQGKTKAGAVVKGLVSFEAFVKPFVQPMIQHSLQTVSLRTGSQEMQQRMQFAYSLGEQAIGIVESIAVGAALGHLPGAILGAVMGLATTAINYANQKDTIRMEQNLENISLRGMNVRAGGYAPAYGASRMGRQ